MKRETKIIELKQFLDDLEKMAQVAHICGGTVSSANLRDCLWVKQFIEGDQENLARIDQLISIWRERLEAHNSQLLKFITYDVFRCPHK